MIIFQIYIFLFIVVNKVKLIVDEIKIKYNNSCLENIIKLNSYQNRYQSYIIN